MFVLWFAESRSYAKEIREASHKVPVTRINGSCTNSYQNLISARGWPFNFFQPEDIGRSIALINDCFHHGSDFVTSEE